MTRPLVTFAMYAYNEEKFIREAVESAFAQTYSPLEIVLSDDGSHDRTFEIMQEMAAAYQGLHKIILNRNDKNIGIGSQLNAAYQKSRGGLILLANGDDISLPDRTTKTVEAWLKAGSNVHAITTDLATMDESGIRLSRIMTTETLLNNLEEGVSKRFGGVGAASMAITRRVFSDFGPLNPNLILEDGPLFLRAFLLGERIHLRESLVLYRIHRNNISQAYAVEDFQTWVSRHHMKARWQCSEGVKAYQQMINDLSSNVLVRWSDNERKRARWIAIEKMIENEFRLDYYSGDNAVSRSSRLRALGRLVILFFKLIIKSWLPIIERRNDRWHYQSAKKANSK